jgi:hypothetical protein
MEFVNFELSKKLKDLGYNVPFFFFYRTDDQLLHHAMVGQPLVYGKRVDNEVVIAPTISQVLNWLRKEKKIHIIIPASFDESYWWEARDFNRGISEYYDVKYTSYEEAALAGIEYVLDTRI